MILLLNKVQQHIQNVVSDYPEFGADLREAARAGVKVLAVECGVTPRSLVMTRPVSVALQGRRKDSAPGGTL